MWELKNSPEKTMANVNLNTKVTANVRFNALEISILETIGFDRMELAGDNEFTIEEMRKLNNKIAQSYNPDNDNVNVAERFTKEDHTGKVPVKHLFDKTETILANMERQKVVIDQFNYDNNAEL